MKVTKQFDVRAKSCYGPITYRIQANRLWVKVGCSVFRRSMVLSALRELYHDNNPVAEVSTRRWTGDVNYELVATRKGVDVEERLFSWGTIRRVLRELEKI